MPGELLEKTRRLNRILQSSGSEPVLFADLCKILSEILETNVYVISRKGRILGYSLIPGLPVEAESSSVFQERLLPQEYNDQLMRIAQTQANIENKQFYFPVDIPEYVDRKRLVTIIPVSCGGDRLGSLIFERFTEPFSEEDLVVAEYSATIVGMEIMRAKTEEIEEEARKKAVVQMAIGTLSFSELEAVEHIFNELDGEDGLLVASKIADRVGITRSVIVNALRKLESAGVIESRSLGMKGTHIRILNDKLLDELEKIK